MSQTKSKLFGNFDVNNKPHRSGFDLSRRNLFSAKVGELLPVFCENVLPGDHWKLSASSFTRTQPVESAAFTRIFEYVDFFFVPYRLLWRNAHASFTQLSDAKNVALSPTSTQNINDKVPYIGIYAVLGYLNKTKITKSEVGSDYVQDVLKLLTYLGYGDFLRLYKQSQNSLENLTTLIDNYNVSLLPLLAYQKIYFDFYRNSQWEVNQANAYNVDYMNAQSTDFFTYMDSNVDIASTGVFNLRYANYAKDILIGLLPSAQYGDAAKLTTNSTGSFNIAPNGLNLGEFGVRTSSDKELKVVSINNQQFGIVGAKDASVNETIHTTDITNSDAISSSISQIDLALTALDIRNLMATQKWREVANSGDRTYRDQVKKHFGVDLPAVLDQNCTYINGWKGTIAINEVVNQNLIAEEQTDIKGKGTGNLNANTFDFDVKEHGLILGIYHAAPMVDYSFTAPSRQLQTINIADFFIPEYDRLGFEEVKSSDFFDSKIAQLTKPITLGYAPRYWMYKTATDQVQGIFRTSLPQWVAPFDESYFRASLTQSTPVGESPKLTYKFFKVNPSILDDIFGVNAFSGTSQIDNDQLLISLDMSCFATRNMDFSGIPY